MPALSEAEQIAKLEALKTSASQGDANVTLQLCKTFYEGKQAPQDYTQAELEMIRQCGVQTVSINTVIDEILAMKETLGTSSIGREIVDMIRLRERLRPTELNSGTGG